LGYPALGYLEGRLEHVNLAESRTGHFFKNTTMRGCELKGLCWKDIDLFEKILAIRRESTKTNAGARTIPLNRDAIEALVRLKGRGEKLGSGDPEHYVFPACESLRVDAPRPMKGLADCLEKLEPRRRG
jgi:integrase